MVEEPIQNLNVPSKAIREEEQKDQENLNDHENEQEQPTAILFTLEQLEVLLKMNRPDFTKLVVALKGGSSKGVGFQPTKPRKFDGIENRKVVDVWLVEMEDYIHATKVERHSAMELAQSYFKSYVSTWWRTLKQEEKKTHGYTWEFLKEHIELEFNPKNFNYILRCKLRDLVNVTNDNLRQYVKAYSKLMLEIQHMHELNRVCHFMMGLPTWAKHKLEENCPTSLSKAIMKMESFSNVGRDEKFDFKKGNKFPHEKACHEGEWN